MYGGGGLGGAGWFACYLFEGSWRWLFYSVAVGYSEVIPVHFEFLPVLSMVVNLVAVVVHSVVLLSVSGDVYRVMPHNYYSPLGQTAW